MSALFKIFILFIVLVSGIFLIQNLVNLLKVSQPEIKIEEGQQIEKEIFVSLGLDFGRGNIKTFNDIELKEEKTVFDLLKKVTGENNLEFSFKEYPGSGVFIESIGRTANDAKINKWWQYWVNGEYAKIGASDFQLKNGDFIEWKYIEGQF